MSSAQSQQSVERKRIPLKSFFFPREEEEVSKEKSRDKNTSWLRKEEGTGQMTQRTHVRHSLCLFLKVQKDVVQTVYKNGTERRPDARVAAMLLSLVFAAFDHCRWSLSLDGDVRSSLTPTQRIDWHKEQDYYIPPFFAMGYRKEEIDRKELHPSLHAHKPITRFFTSSFLYHLEKE